jgi:YHS domain-containing protein
MHASWWTAAAAVIALTLCGCSKGGGTKVASADEVAAAKQTAGTANGRCPVLTDELVEKDAPTRTYKDPVSGKDVKVGFCCTKCPKDFDKDPEKYMKRMRDDPARFAYSP